ncbi:hypothetical protein [Blastococcus sp. URHD0036]|uniref:hypothetical protein n=1 Tax=Blastococcus sp. URHD0036 TaxID=1380356 RepID=UPI0004963732|nr:hypothetical protein [Blastococcus sp. URHD0036]
MTAALGGLVVPDPRARCGVEQEFAVRDAAGLAVDVRERIDGWALGARFDPGDPHAARGRWGGVVTADGPEAEVVTPPVVVGRGTAAQVHAWAAAGRDALAGELPPGWTLAGYSTHVSTSVDDDLVVQAARLVVRRLAPALMLLLDGPDSPGLLVRPRPGRLEICGEYAEGRSLRHAAAVAVAASGLAADAVRSRRTRALLPPPLRVRTQRAVQRYGTYVDRRAFGPDLYAEGRTARLRSRGGTTTAGAHLARVVDLLGDRLAELLDADDLAALHAVTAGDLPLPVERDTPERDDAPRATPRPMDLRPRAAARVRVEVVTATWWTYVVRLDTAHRSRWLTLPGSWIESFLEALHAGRLDDVLADLVPAPAGTVTGAAPRSTRWAGAAAP